MRFSEHGVFEVLISNDTLIVDATGPFNAELINHYENALDSCIQKLEGTVWDQIVILHNNSLFTPDAEQKLIQTLINRRERGLRASAVILKDADYSFVLKEQMSRCYKLAGIQYDFFAGADEARIWFNQL